jgi:general secretion pathway protein F
MSVMPNFQYRAMTQNGEVVSGSLSAPTAAEVSRRIEYLGLVPIEAVAEKGAAGVSLLTFDFLSQPRADDVTIFTRDLALLLKAGARIDHGLELLANDADIGRLRPVIGRIKADVLAGESFADAIARHPALFAAMYVALVRVGEASGTLEATLEMLADERDRAAAVRRKLVEALRYPAFLLFAAGCVLTFFLMFVLPQFSSILRDFNAKLDPVVVVFLDLSDLLHAHAAEMGTVAAILVVVFWLILRRDATRRGIVSRIARWPGVRPLFEAHRTALFCRNLGILLRSGVNLTSTLRILVDIMAVTGDVTVWTTTADRVRHGGKLSEALQSTGALPAVAARMLRLGEETGQLAVLSGRVSDFYETKLGRSLDRVVAIAGPLAIVIISVVIGGLIVSVMTALLSISQVIT